MESSVTSGAASFGGRVFHWETGYRELLVIKTPGGGEDQAPPQKAGAKSLFRNILPISTLAGKI
jgi:hypothetical protein